MSAALTFFLPMKPPTTTLQQQEVAVRNGKPFFFMGPDLKNARLKLEAHLAQHRPPEPFTGPLRVMVKWLFPTNKASQHGKYKSTRPDTGNLNKLLLDVMEDLKFYHNDAQVASEIIEKFWSQQPGIWISIERLES